MRKIRGPSSPSTLAQPVQPIVNEDEPMQVTISTMPMRVLENAAVSSRLTRDYCLFEERKPLTPTTPGCPQDLSDADLEVISPTMCRPVVPSYTVEDQP